MVNSKNRKTTSEKGQKSQNKERFTFFGRLSTIHYPLSTPRSERGFTIVELLVTLIVGAIIVASANVMIVSQARLSQRGRDLAMANAYAEHKVESLRSIGFSGLSDGTTSFTTELPSELNSPRSGTLVISSYSAAIKQAVISITYNDQGTNRTYSYTTFIGELGVGQY